MDDHLACAVAGITADANILINYGITTRSHLVQHFPLVVLIIELRAARLAAQRYTLTYQEPIPIEQLIVNICDRKQGYTQVDYSKTFIEKALLITITR